MSGRQSIELWSVPAAHTAPDHPLGNLHLCGKTRDLENKTQPMGRVSLYLGLVLTLLVLWQLRAYLFIHTVPRSTIRRIMLDVLHHAESSRTQSSPSIALVQVRECRAALHVLLELVGGSATTLLTVCHVDVEKLHTLLSTQEWKLRSLLDLDIIEHDRVLRMSVQPGGA